ncbi:protein kinase [Paenibacillus sp. sptzw28]|uniref:serine/threonine protein kinase n=1 Tax=Paenibacillus sp. sptzw28 TaxID=715179 RepID=UPI001C6E6E0B|nr:protein kinase [Paenibacillus sp. sptzw28]QYR19416.1 protein kinase [Paenibacillus sp. sptzw28]
MFSYLRRVFEAWIDFPEREGKVIGGKYRIIRFLGMGSYGLTYLCLDIAAGGQVAVKQAKPSKGRLGRELLRREIEIMRQLLHPSIPRCLAVIENKKRLYMVTEFVNGQTVEDLIFERGAVFTEKEAIGIISRLMEIVCFIHHNGFVHLDIRIPNVMLQGDRISLIDFGLASRLGEPARAQPDADEETRLRRTAVVTSDLYAIGHFLLFMLYSGYDRSDAHSESTAGWEEELNVSPLTKRMIRKLLQIDTPYTDSLEFMRELDDAMNRL